MNESVRADFPLLERRIDGRPIVYLDSAATALKPRSVLEAEGAYSTEFTANVHRGKHALSEEASAAFEQARRRVATFLGADPSEVVFVRNTTEGINLVARGLRLGPQAGVVVSQNEHHSNLVPWMSATRAHLLSSAPESPLEVEAVMSAVRQHRPALLAIGHASNVTGAVNPVKELCHAARKEGVLTLVDAAQSAPHFRLDVGALGCDFLVFSGHKMLAPAGVGVLFGRGEALERLEPLVLGGGVVDRVTRDGFTLKGLPYRLEAGTPNVGGVLGLAAALDYLERFAEEERLAHEESLASALYAQLGDLPGMRLLMARGSPRLAVGTVVPKSPNVQADHLALMLSDTHKVMVRSGYFCAHPCFDALGLTTGGLRASAYLYNTEEEIRFFGESLRRILQRLS